MKRTLIIASLAFCAASFAYDGDMDVYHELKEELALIRDGYVASINMAMEDAQNSDPAGWFKARDSGEAEDWDDIEYTPPEKSSLPHVDIEEIPYGFKIMAKHDAYVVNATVRVVTRDSDIFYDVTFQKGSNAPGKEIFGEVFRNDRKVFYDNSTPCKRASVTCIDGYSRGTLGKSQNK
ncbi:MAG: hypothetical protein MJY99_04690 [Fibrobacter sp.]|nr:hypothetical protein [Fibrobacter sp.]